MQRWSAMTTAQQRLPLLLADHHRRLDSRCEALLECAYADDARGLVTGWRELEPELLEHMAQEEATILPRYAAFAPDDAGRIRAEHAQIRALIAALALDISRAQLRCAMLRELVDLLRRHARSEEEHMYAWAQRNLTQRTSRSLFALVCQWFGVASNEGMQRGAELHERADNVAC